MTRSLAWIIRDDEQSNFQPAATGFARKAFSIQTWHTYTWELKGYISEKRNEEKVLSNDIDFVQYCTYQNSKAIRSQRCWGHIHPTWHLGGIGCATCVKTRSKRAVAVRPNMAPWRWNLHKDGKFSVESMYKTLVLSDAPVINNNHIWKRKLSLKTTFLCNLVLIHPGLRRRKGSGGVWFLAIICQAKLYHFGICLVLATLYNCQTSSLLWPTYHRLKSLSIFATLYGFNFLS
jgi:hypothetical protein